MMIKIDWKKDYCNEFTCYKCDRGILLLREYSGKRRIFQCRNCQKKSKECCVLKDGYLSSRLRAYGLACPKDKCNNRQMVLDGKVNGKNRFKCKICGASALESNDISKINLSRLAHRKTTIKNFVFEDDLWDLRTINALASNNNRYNIDFSRLKCIWFKLLTKKYIYHLCRVNKSLSTIHSHLVVFRQFSSYLVKKNILDLEQINRDLIIDFTILSKTTEDMIRHRLRSLRGLFITGNIQGWFQLDPDIIRDSDYPKKRKSNPDPIPDLVREQIEKNLYKLPAPLARMWIICFFAAMRPGELALLKKECLEQVGDKWKLVWWRKKGRKIHQHSVPITTTIAKVIQEQLEYIEELWGKDWEYLFCHYQKISQSDPTHPKLKPVKKVLSTRCNPLHKAIVTLIKSENIRDNNGQLAQFKPRLIRETRLTELFLKGHDLSVVSGWAGHKKLATTANFYTQVTCQQIEKEVGHIQSALVNAEGKKIYYESMPKSFWENPVAHELEIAGTHVNTPIYGYCGLDLEKECDKFRACYTCRFFVAKPEKLSQYIKQRDELRDKQEQALANGHSVLVEQFARQADQLDKIILSLQEAA